MRKDKGSKTDKLDFKELQKQKKEQEQRIKKSNNPFLSVIKKSDNSMYNQLYKFDVKAELGDYNLPFGQEQEKKNAKLGDKTVNMSKVSSFYDNESKAESEQEPSQRELEADIHAKPNYTNIVKSLYQESTQKPQNKIQNALFVDKSVSGILKTIKTGEAAISFFAKYGNTTPIKFINCIQKVNTEQFRPYDLEVISTNENQKQMILNEYYTISAHGIVKVYSEKMRKQLRLEGREETASTEVVGLSDWMHESTLFNIITNIQFFKSYTLTKIFGIWKKNVRFRDFLKKRKKLVADAFLAKPTFSQNLMEINKSLFDLQSNRTISARITENRTWEKKDFNFEQQNVRKSASAQYEAIITGKMTGVVKKVQNDVFQKCNQKEFDEEEELRFGQQVKQKPMNLIRRQKQERKYLLEIAYRDKERLGNFIKLVDYMMIETLVQTNYKSMLMLIEEMKKKQKKTGLFNIGIREEKMTFDPNEEDLKDNIENTLKNMIDVIKTVHRIPNQVQNNSFTDEKQDKLIDIGSIILQSVQYNEIRGEMIQKIRHDFEISTEYVEENYKKVREILAFLSTFQMPNWDEGKITFNEIREKIHLFTDWNSDIKARIKDISKGCLNINGSKIATNLTRDLDSKLSVYKEQLSKLMVRKMKKCIETIDDDLKILQNPNETLKEYGDFIENYNRINDDNKNLENQKIEIENMQSQLKKLEGSIPSQYARDLIMLKDKYGLLQNELKKASDTIESKRSGMLTNIQTEINSMCNQIKGLETGLMKEKFVDETCPPQDAIKQLESMNNKIIKQKEKNEAYERVHKLMGVQPSPNKQLADLMTKYNDRKLLWTHVDEFMKLQEHWQRSNIRELNAEDIQKDVQQFDLTVLQLRIRITNLSKDGKDKVLEAHEGRIKGISALMPIIGSVANADLKEKHWKKIFEKLQQPFQPGKHVSLTELLGYGIMEKKEAIEEISARASGQRSIEAQLEEIKEKWGQLNFIVIPYRESRDKFIIGSVQEIMQALDDHQLKIQSMMGSRYVAEIRETVEVIEKRLLLISQIIDEWLACQRQWMYLENIFSAEDIQKQLPEENKKFVVVDKFWKDIMMKTNKRPLVYDCCASEDLLRKFQKNNKELEEIQKKMEDYLEVKRSAFPRFYFLSNDELLEILSQTRNPHAVQGHLRKCFDNINRIEFTDVEESREIVAMISAEPETMPEYVKFSASVFSEGPVEHWLMRIQEMMIQSLYDISKQALKEYPDEDPFNRENWLFSCNAQSILLIDQVKWTEGVTSAILNESRDKSKGIKYFEDFMKEIINQEVSIVRKELNILQRTLMGALIVLDVHARDVVSELIHKKITNLNDFEFAKQLRYYWEAEVDDCVVRQTNTYFRYGYEYLGNGPRLVITPLTDKCYITLTSAKHLQYGGNPAGPAGTGKTETTKDLGKALAIQCVVFNCSDGLEYKIMGRFFSGLAQGGAWSCFDEFNRIDIEVLSVIAQQILTIQQAIKRDDIEFQFETRIIPLNKRFGVFITMNPGYAGRTELPDNLKTLFRPVAMMIPDYALIAEIILFSEGFETAKSLARKMVQLYKLSSEQLSKQDHYDFGMRAVKSVLVMAGALRRKESKLPEDVVLIRAMRDSNVPKFLEHDLPLFMGIISDLFPKVEIPNIDYGNLQKAIENQLQVRNYQKPKKFLTKIIQLIETIMVRHGVMVVGLTGTGKTTAIHTLAKAMEQLHKEGSTDYYHKPVKQERLNPKSVTMNELFGYTNILTNQWHDGIVAAIVRSNVSDTSDIKKWIIFDGPVDALWIENMNTVLDDNKMLCLSNGQRIKLPATFTMMFEVNDLAVASPATVSRCGMVYLEPVHLGWEPIIDTWAVQFKQEKMKDNVVPAYVTNVIEKMKVIFKENLGFLREDCKEVIGTTNNNLVQSCINIFNILYDEMTQAQNLDKMSNFDADSCCSMVLIFSFVWSAGANLHDSIKDNSRSKFSQHIKNKILKFYSSFPYEGEIYDYFIDFKTKQFKNWTELVTDFKYDPEVPYFNILVPTADTVKYKYILGKLVGAKKNCLLSGETGVGKSVIIGDFLGATDLTKYAYTIMNFSAQTSTKNVLDVFLDKDKFTKKRRTEIGPLGSKKMIFYVDDINMPALERYFAQPPNELLRQIIDQKGFYDLKKFLFMEVSDCVFISSCAPPGGGRNQVTPRLFRHFNMVWAPDLSVRSMDTIFTSILKGFLSYSKGLEKFAPSIVKSSLEMYGKIRTELLPTPTKSHYTFNLRDLSKVFQGILQIEYENLPNKETLISLWVHESQRIFHDRLADDKDRSWFFSVIEGYLKNNFQIEWETQKLRQILFGDYNNMHGKYVKVDDIEALPKKFLEFLAKHNGQYPMKSMSLVFFKDAILHLSRICRILKQNRGNALLIGVGGSGRQSLTRLASSIRDFKIFTIEITKNYKDPQWKDDLKSLIKTAGKNEQVTFLFSDTQIVKESFLEDLNNILNTGEVPNMWGPEDYEQILAEMRVLATKEKEKIIDTRENLMKLFIQKTRQNLHIVLAFSPVGSKLRDRCRQFPSIINCCTIDWFDRWPNEALYSVAIKDYKANQSIGIIGFVEKLADISMYIHNSVIDYSEQFYDELRRKNYVTPTSYLQLMKLYMEMMKYQQGILPQKINKYTVGLETLKETNQEVEKLKQKIIEMQPQLEQFAKETAEMVVELEKQTKAANEVEAVCTQDTNEAQGKRDEVNELKNICKAQLDKAIPILNKAKDAVGSIDKKGLQEMKAYAQPPALVQMVLKAVCLILGEKESWDDAKKKILTRLDLLDVLSSFKAGSMTERQVKRLRDVYINDNDFDPEKVARQSGAAKNLSIWVGAVEALFRVEKEVQPKKQKLAKAEEVLKVVEGQLAVKQKALKQIQDKVASLQRSYESTLRKSESLQEQKEIAAIQLVRAEKLVGGLSGEAQRWKINVAKLNEDKRCLIGNIILCAASVAYIGPFISEYRNKMVKDWAEKCKEIQIPVSDDYLLERILSEEVQIRDWQEHGLPTDSLSTDNGIFIFNCRRWPLIIDPQGQANKWIKNMYKDQHMHVTKLSEANFLKILENAIRNGQIVLMENIQEELDPSLEPILGKQLMKKGQQWLLRLGDQDIPYNHDFKFYLTTKLPNPHYIPEICIKTTIINFTVTPRGLEDQLLAEVVRFERIQLQTKRVELILQISADKKELQELEDKILRQIGEAQGRILEDEDLINTLDAAKVTSEGVNERIELAKITSQEIDKARQEYRSIAKRGSVIYFVISDLSNIDPMYQYSLDYFLKLFKKRLESTEKKEILQERIDLLISDLTESFYTNICRGLFEKDKLLYSFMIASKIELYDKKINPVEWGFFLRGGTGEQPLPETLPSFTTEKMYKDLMDLTNLTQPFKSVINEIKNPNNENIWKNLMQSESPTSVKLPQNLEIKLDMFQKIIIYKILREQSLIGLIKFFVLNVLGKLFIESPVFDLKGSFNDSSPTIPIVFVLSPGADPISYLLNLAKEKQMDTRLKMLSLGQGQGGFAKELIKNGRRNGDWVCLQNCHLAVSWMPTLEKIQEDQVLEDTHPDYRLWLTSMPSNKFPVPVLQNSIKVTNEPPKGLKANLLRSYNDISDKSYDECTKDREFKLLLFSLAFFHAVILERRKYGAIGWNIPYEWMNSDFETSQLQLKMYLDEQPMVPYKTLNYLIAEINYGGRVTDDKDVRLITALLLSYLNEDVMKGEYKFSRSGIYHSPKDLDLSSVKDYISNLPLEDDPEIYGLHRNANITFQQKNAREFFETLLSIQPRTSGGDKSGETPDEIGDRMARDIESRMPEVLPVKKIENPNSLDIFRMQEVDRFNKLIKVMKKSLSDLQKAIKGTTVMSIQLEKMFYAFLDKKVPELWEDVAYPSLKPLGSWVNDFIERVSFFRKWVENGKMDSYWVSALFFPQGFMTAAMQTYARRTHIAIDTLVFRAQIRPYFQEEVTESPTDGVNIHGLFIEGCRCEKSTGYLEESDPKILFVEMPVIWLEPVIIDQYHPKEIFYQCPLYKTSTRKGTLSTTGHSTNFVMFLGIKSHVDPEHWVRRGVAMLCQLDD